MSRTKKFIQETNARNLDQVYGALVTDLKVTPLVKVCRATYYLNEKDKKGAGLFSASYRLMWGSKEELAAKIEAAGFKVRTMGDNEFSAWVTFDVPTKWERGE
jgi:hypothetical protein